MSKDTKRAKLTILFWLFLMLKIIHPKLLIINCIKIYPLHYQLAAQPLNPRPT